MNNLAQWKPSTQWSDEDKLIHEYWQTVGGIIYTEVVVGGRGKGNIFPKGTKPRRIDGIRILPLDNQLGATDIVTYSKSNAVEFEGMVDGAIAEVIEVKTSLGRYVIGQAIIGVDLLELVCKPAITLPVILCEVGDPLLEMICKKHGVAVWKSASK